MLPQAVSSARDLERLIREAEHAVGVHEASVARTLTALDRQQLAVTRLNDVTARAASSAVAVLTFANDLAAVAERLPDELAQSRDSLEMLASALGGVQRSLEGGRDATVALDGDWANVADAVEAIAKTAGRARVLAINAAIEAAYVEASRSGFGIVADRMRGLSSSILTAAKDVSSIVVATRASSTAVLAATDAADRSSRGVLEAIGNAAMGFHDAQQPIDAFTDGIARIAAIADEQQTTGRQIANSIEGLATAAASAGEQAQRASVGVGSGIDYARDALACETDEAVLRGALRGLAESAIASARAAASWNAVDTGVASLRDGLSQVRSGVVESASAAAGLEDAATTIATTLAQIDAILSTALSAFEAAVAEVANAREHTEAVRSSIHAIDASTNRAGEIVETVAEISAESGLLALNAAIEAARAGKQGAGFTVIANEIGRLAKATRGQTDGISTTIQTLRERGEALARLNAVGTIEVETVADGARLGRATIDTLRETIASTVARSASVGTAARDLVAGSRQIQHEIEEAAHHLADLQHHERDEARTTLSALLGTAYESFTGEGGDYAIFRLRDTLFGVAEQIEHVYAQTISSGRATIDRFKDTAYVELRGSETKHMARLVAPGTVMPDRFTPPKYRTSYDALVDNELIDRFERAQNGESLIKAIAAFDLNSFAIAMTPDRSRTTVWNDNRVKRINEDPVALYTARVGLGNDAHRAGSRLPYSAFEARGCSLRRTERRPWSVTVFLQTDTGKVYLNVATAVYIGDTRVGSVSLIADAQQALD